MIAEMLLAFFSALFINNIVLVRYLGTCPFCGVSKNVSSALGMGLAVLFVMTCASATTWIMYSSVLVPLHMEWLKTIVFILVIATLVQLVELFVKKKVVSLYRSLGIYLPLITTNCAVLGVSLLAVREGYGLLQTLLFAVASACGFILALLCMAGIRQRMELTVGIPVAFKGVAITLVVAGIMAVAFYGFNDMDSVLLSLIRR